MPHHTLAAVLLAASLACACSDALERDLEQTEAELQENRKKLRASRAGNLELMDTLADNAATLDRVPGTLELETRFEYGGEPIEIDREYPLAGGTVKFHSLRYWLSNVALAADGGEWVSIPDSYYLMEVRKKYVETPGEKLSWVVQRRESVSMREVPAGRYTRLSFDIGVDPAHNDDLTLAGGELNVLSHMANAKWMWFTSYIFTSLSADYVPPGAFPDDSIVVSWQGGMNEHLRRVELTLPNEIEVGFERAPRIELSIDAARLFDSFMEKILDDAKAFPEFPQTSIGPENPVGLPELANNWRAAYAVRSPPDAVP